MRSKTAITLLTAACLVASLMLGATAGAKPASAKHKHRRPAPSGACPAGNAHSLGADAQAHVYTTRNSFGGESVRGCVYGSKHSYLLGPLPECGSPGRCLGVKTVALAGPVVAYGSFSALAPSLPSEATRHSYVVVVRDLRTDRLLRVTPTGIPVGTPTPGSVGVGPAVAIVVKSDGAVAWIVENVAAPTGANYEIYAAEAAGGRLLASGAGIDPSSLTLTGSTVQWTQAGQMASSALN